MGMFKNECISRNRKELNVAEAQKVKEIGIGPYKIHTLEKEFTTDIGRIRAKHQGNGIYEIYILQTVGFVYTGNITSRINASCQDIYKKCLDNSLLFSVI
jgi:hypothetical protein